MWLLSAQSWDAGVAGVVDAGSPPPSAGLEELEVRGVSRACAGAKEAVLPAVEPMRSMIVLEALGVGVDG